MDGSDAGDIQILTEREAPSGLVFGARMGERRCEVHLHWADYNLWSPDGADPPERVAAAALRYLAEVATGEPVPAVFDAATLRRRFPGADERIQRLVRQGT